MNSPLSSTPSIASRMRGKSGSYWALTSTSGIGRTPAKSSSSPSSGYEKCDREQDECNDRVVESASHAVVVRSHGPADAGEPEAEDGTPDQCESEETSERHAAETGRDRDEGTDSGRHETDGHRHRPEAVEPASSALEAFRRDVQEPAATLEPLLGVRPDQPPADRAGEISEQPR